MKTVILAGGFGTRLSEYTDRIPKPMVKIGELPILMHIINFYRCFNHNEFIIATGYKSEMINDYFEVMLRSKDQEYNFMKSKTIPLSQSKNNLIVKTIFSGIDSMTGGRLLPIKDFIDEDNFMLTYGDGLSNVNISELIDFHKKHNKIATITAVHPKARFGVLNLEGEKVTDFQEKRQLNQGWINGGFFIFKKKIFDYIDNQFTVLEKEPLEKLAKEEQLMAFKHSGFWQCMDTKRDREFLQEIWDSGSPPWNEEKKL